MARGRRKRREPVRVEDRVEATPETTAKLTADPLMAMVEAGQVDSAGERAASEIRAVYLAVCRAVMVRPTNLGGEFCAPSRGKPAEIPESLARAHAERYLPWTRDHDPETLDDLLRVVVEREPIAPWRRHDIAVALDDYARRMP